LKKANESILFFTPVATKEEKGGNQEMITIVGFSLGIK
jgi:hypothetical protein